MIDDGTLIQDLKKRLSVQATELALERRNRSDASTRVKDLLSEIDALREQRDKDVYDARIEAELTTLQLHQLKAELDQSLTVVRMQSEIIKGSVRLQERMAGLLVNIFIHK
tara:strand:- start:108 stop:440 length:333 start_codon:yes stop_codon:yes gene_type:complete